MITDDAILVNMALSGKREAFDELVRKHRSRVLSAARMLVGSADGSEDVAQQAFVAAFADLRLLNDPAKFRPWLMTITRRYAIRHRTAQFWEAPGLDETVMAAPCHQPAADSALSAGVAEILAELSARDRKVVVMHYLDGCSCREIGESLGLPPGTVKRILHESRSALRASSEQARGAGEMSQKGYGPRHMAFWVNGSDPHMMGDMLRQSICLTINKKGLTPKQIASRIEATEPYVRESLDVLEAEGLVENVGQGRYRNTFVALGADDWIEITREITAKSERVADMMVEALPELQAAWEKSPKPGQGFDWNAGIWPVLALMVCAAGLGRNRLADTGPKPLHPVSGRRYWAGGREQVATEHVLWVKGFSINSVRDTPGSGFSHGLFWSYGLPFARPADHPDGDELRIVRAVASGFTDIDSVAGSTGIRMERVREVATRMQEIEALRCENDRLMLTFPVFNTEDDNAMLTTVNSVIERLLQEVDSATRLVDEKFPELGFGYLEEQFGQWRRWLRGDAAAEGLRVLFNRGILPHPGDPAPMNFCTVGWFEGTKLFVYE